LSLDGKKILVRKGDSLYVIDAKPAKVSKLADNKVDLEGWSFSIDVRDDWRQIFVDAWRLERDYFYDPNMHGVDWDGVLQKYLPLVDRVTTRNELSDLIGRVVGELAVTSGVVMTTSACRHWALACFAILRPEGTGSITSIRLIRTTPTKCHRWPIRTSIYTRAT
jgi:hypothetical protein